MLKEPLCKLIFTTLLNSVHKCCIKVRADLIVDNIINEHKCYG